MVADEEAFDELSRTQPIPIRKDPRMLDTQKRKYVIDWEDVIKLFGFGLAVVTVIFLILGSIVLGIHNDTASRERIARDCINTGGIWNNEDCIRK